MSTAGGGETKADPSSWTVDSLSTHIQALLNARDVMWMELRKSDQDISQQRFAAQRELTLQAMESAQRAINKAEIAVEKRLENTNEWRAAMNDRDVKLLPRMEYDRAHGDILQRVNDLAATSLLLLKRETFDSILKEWSSWREQVERRQTVIETRSITWTAAIGFFFTVIQIFLFWFLRK